MRRDGRTPRQNRVTPWSTLVAVPAYGTLMGNRGCLHDDGGRIVRAYRGRLWIACETAFRGRHRAVMQPGRYTELFFLDEAVAFAAGHRPCAECRRGDYNAFRRAWDSAGLPACAGAADLDRVLHAARLDRGGQRRGRAACAGLPDGSFVDCTGEACLVRDGRLWPWSPGGYGPSRPLPATSDVDVLTPGPLLAVLAAGYRLRLHPSCDPVADGRAVVRRVGDSGDGETEDDRCRDA